MEDLPGLNSQYLEKAVKGLLKTLSNTQSDDLLASHGPSLNLTFSLAKIPPGVHPKPLGITLPHPVYLRDSISVCVIVRDLQRKWKDILETNWKSDDMGGLEPPKIIGLSKLKKNYPTMASRRQLMRTYDLFLCDTHIIDQMPRILGRTFMDAGKMPIGVRIKETDFQKILKQRLSQTFLRIRTGLSISVRIGYSEDNSTQLCDNALCVLKAVSKYFVYDPPNEESMESSLDKFRDNQIHYVHLTATDCPSLPIYINPTISEAMSQAIMPPTSVVEVQKPKAKKMKTMKRVSA